MRAQAAKLLGENHVTAAADVLVRALRDAAPRVRFFAAQSLGKIGQREGAAPLLALLRENDNKDNYIRHAAVMGLVGCKNFPALARGAKSDSAAERLGVLLAWRRLDRGEIAAFLADPDPFIVREAALAINDAPVNAALPALAGMISAPIADGAVLIRAINANFRLGRPENAAALATFAADPARAADLRAEALAQLALWSAPPARDRIVGIYRPLTERSRDRSTAATAVAQVLPKLLAASAGEEVELASIAAVASLKPDLAADNLVAVVRDETQLGKVRAAALNVLDQLKDPRLTELVAVAGASTAPVLRLTALPVAARLSPDAAAPLLERLVAGGNVDEQKAAFRILGTIQHPSADPLLASRLDELAAGRIKPAVELELLEAAAKRTDPAVKKRLAERDARLTASGDKRAGFRMALEGGDPARGRKIFNTQPIMACVRCHNPGTGGGDAGPHLAGVAARHPREYFLESVVRPNAAIAPGFDTVAVTRKSGAVVAGIVDGENAESVHLRDLDGKVTVVPKAEIQKREGVPSSMPEIYATILTKAELRDVVEYLASLTTVSDEVRVAETPRALRHLDE